jgi:hypothetical protein
MQAIAARVITADHQGANVRLAYTTVDLDDSIVVLQHIRAVINVVLLYIITVSFKTVEYR